MIESDLQLDITRYWRKRFATALELMDDSQLELANIQRAAHESMIAEFDRDISDYLAKHPEK